MRRGDRFGNWIVIDKDHFYEKNDKKRKDLKYLLMIQDIIFEVC